MQVTSAADECDRERVGESVKVGEKAGEREG